MPEQLSKFSYDSVYKTNTRAVGNLRTSSESLTRSALTVPGALDSTGNTFTGSYSYTLVDGNGNLLGARSGTVTGQSNSPPLLP